MHNTFCLNNQRFPSQLFCSLKKYFRFKFKKKCYQTGKTSKSSFFETFDEVMKHEWKFVANINF